MKRKWLYRFLAAAALLGLLVFPAYANPHWVVKPVGWQICNANAGGVWCRDTAFTSVAASVIDTTAWFQLDRAWVQPAVAAGDSIRVGYLILQGDSSAVYTANLTALTVAVDLGPINASQAAGNTAALVIQQTLAASVYSPGSKLVTTGDKVVAIPLVVPSAILTNSVATTANGMMFMPMRARITATTGVLTACRVFVAYLRDEI